MEFLFLEKSPAECADDPASSKNDETVQHAENDENHDARKGEPSMSVAWIETSVGRAVWNCCTRNVFLGVIIDGIIVSSRLISAGSVFGEEDEVPELREGRFAQRMKKGKMWTSEDSYENDREVMSEYLNGFALTSISGNAETVLNKELIFSQLEGNNNPKEKVLWAAEKNELELLEELVASDPTLVHARDSDNYTPLHRACYSDNIEVIKVRSSACFVGISSCCTFHHASPIGG